MENNNTSARQHNKKVGSVNGATWNKRELALRCAFNNKTLVKETLAYIASMACVVSAGVSLSSVDGNYFSNLSQILAHNIGGTLLGTVDDKHRRDEKPPSFNVPY